MVTRQPLKSKGFTLIEILIVIAIIGILASIVVVSLRGASERTKNTKIVTDIVQVRKVAEVMYVQEATGYENLCSQGTLNVNNETLLTLKNDIEYYSGSSDVITCYASVRSYCVSVELLGVQTKWFCIDDEGNNEEFTTNPCIDADSKCE